MDARKEIIIIITRFLTKKMRLIITLLLRHSYLFLLVVLSFFSSQTLAQCTVEAFADPINIVCGQTVQLSATGNSGNLALDNNFNNGTPGSGWSATPAAVFNNPCTPGNGSTHMWMGDNTPQPRILTTVALDLSLGGQICFDLRFSVQADPAPCEGPDESDEGVYLQYSTNGGTNWTNINYFDPLGGYDPTLTAWNTYCFPIPAGAMTPNTLIRWFQDATSGAEYDHWGIDNVQIILNDPSYFYVWLHDQSQTPTPPVVSPTADSTFTVVYTNGTNDACSASVNVIVTDPDINANAGTDQTICPGDCVTLDADAEVIQHPTQQVTFTNTEFQPIVTGFGQTSDININVQGLNNSTINPATIESVCIIGLAPLFTNLGSMTIELECPGGNSIVLVPSGVASGSNMTNTCFVPAGGTALSGGSAPYTGNYTPNQPFSNLNGCLSNGTWVMSVGTSSGFAAGFFNGWSITFNDPQITVPANYTWSPTTGLSDPNSLTPDACPQQTTTYTLTVEDQNQCAQETSSVTITVQPNCCQLAIDNVAFTNPSCGNSDGTIDITSSGGVAPVTYSIDGGFTSQANSGSFVNIQAGIYYIELEDANGCMAYDTLTLTGPSSPSIDNIATVPPTCGVADGEITITASGGAQPLQYSIDGGINFQAGNTFTGLVGGNYNIVVEDANGCQATTQNGLANSSGPTIDNIVPTNPSCGSQDGTITINATGGAQPLQYSIDNGATYQASGTFPGLGPGNYSITVQDATSCTVTDQVTLTAGNGPTIDALNETAPACGASDGIIDITATGGTAPLQYSIDGGTTWQATGSFANLGSGTYDVVVEDNFGCQATDQVVFPGGTPPSIDQVTPADPTCGNATGTIDITASGGTAPLQYSIDNGATYQGSGSFSNLNGGVYDIIVLDATNCQASSQVTLATSSGVTIDTIGGIDPSCGANDGAVGALASGGTAPLQYSIDNGVTFQPIGAFPNLGTGTYTVLVEDANGCQATAQHTLVNLNGPTLVSSTPTATTCGQDDGTITVTANGGTAPLQYSIDNGTTFQGTGSFPDLPAGTYDIVVSDDIGCEVTGQVTVASSTAPVIDDITPTNTTCGANDGEITITVSGGTLPLQYSINAGNTFQSSNSFSNLAAGNYNIVVEDNVGCQVTGQAVITNANGPSITDVSFTDPTCGNANGTITVTASGGVSPLNYSIDNGNNFQPGGQFANVNEGTYTVLVEDADGCQVTDMVTLTNTPSPVITAINTVDATCGESNAALTIVATGGTAPLQFSIDGGITYSIDASYDSLAPGTYTVYVMDANGCEDSQDVTFTPSYFPKAEYTYVPVDATIFDPEITFSNQSSGAVAYQWVFDDLGGSAEEHPIFEFPDNEPGTYRVCLIAINDDECTDTVCKLIRIEEGFTVFVPSAFTPNGNRINDGFFPKTTGVKDYTLYIFDRWGGMIFSSNSDQYPWDGKTRDGREFVAAGVYIWKFVVNDEKHGTHEYAGHVTLIK